MLDETRDLLCGQSTSAFCRPMKQRTSVHSEALTDEAGAAQEIGLVALEESTFLLGRTPPTHVRFRNVRAVRRRFVRQDPWRAIDARSRARNPRSHQLCPSRIPPAVANFFLAEQLFVRNGPTSFQEITDLRKRAALARQRLTDVTTHRKCWMRTLTAQKRLRDLLAGCVVGVWYDLRNHGTTNSLMKDPTGLNWTRADVLDRYGYVLDNLPQHLIRLLRLLQRRSVETVDDHRCAKTGTTSGLKSSGVEKVRPSRKAMAWAAR